jgi:hypothetical protein
MRKVLISLAAAGVALGVAAPASAQYYGAPAYGYSNNNYSQVRSLQYRVDAIQRQINVLDRRNVLSNREARRLRDDSRQVERQLYRAARYGLNPYEARNINYRIARLEQSVQRQAWDRDGRRWDRRDRDPDHDRDRDHDRHHDRD